MRYGAKDDEVVTNDNHVLVAGNVGHYKNKLPMGKLMGNEICATGLPFSLIFFLYTADVIYRLW